MNLAVFTLNRSINNNDVTFIFSAKVYEDPRLLSLSPSGVLLNNALLFNGDRITLSLPQDIPIVRASHIAAQFRRNAK
jgi:hypothetical protein